MAIRGHDPIAWGFEPGPILKNALGHATDLEAQRQDIDAIKAEILKLKPVPPAILKRRGSGSNTLAIEARPTSPPSVRT